MHRVISGRSRIAVDARSSTSANGKMRHRLLPTVARRSIGPERRADAVEAPRASAVLRLDDPAAVVVRPPSEERTPRHPLREVQGGHGPQIDAHHDGVAAQARHLSEGSEYVQRRLAGDQLFR